MKRFTIGMVLMFGLMLAWQWWYQGYYLRKYPQLAESKTQQASSTTQAATLANSQPASGPTTSSTSAEAPATMADNANWGSLHVAGSAVSPIGSPATMLLGSDAARNPTAAIGAGLSARGASIRSITLNEFSPSNISIKERSQPGQYTFQRPLEGDADGTAPLATRWVKFKIKDGQITKQEKTIDLSAVAWRLQAEQSTAAKAVFAVDINDGSMPFARVIKEYELLPRSDPSMGYELIVRQRIVNLTAEGGGAGRRIEVSTMIAGPTLPPRELESNDDRYIVSAVRPSDLYSHNHPVAKFGQKEPAFDLTTKDEDKVAWFGTASAYFAAIVRPEALDQIAQVWAQTPNPTAPVDDIQVTLTMTTRDLPVEAGKEVVVPLRVFFGPKSRAVLQSSHYAKYQYAKTLETSASSCAWCAPDWLSWLLVKMLTTFQLVLRDWGLAIIALVLVVRLLLHPITKRSTISMQRMQKLGPEMERLKQKFGDKKDELNKAMMGLYKEQGIAPMLGCLPMFLQMPIWIALYSSLQNTFELRQAGFLEFFGLHLTWIRDLSQPDRLFEFASPISLVFGWHLRAINLLPIGMAAVFWLQHKFQPKPAVMNEQQAQQQKMMQWMTLLFPVFLYTAPSGLNLYILTSTTIGIIESKRIRDHIKQREEAEKAGKVIVDARPTRSARLGKGADRPEAQRKTGLAGWFARLQEKAAAMQREAEKQRNRKK